MTAAIINADCLDALRAMPDNSVDAIVTDPPYGLSNIKPERITEAIVAWASGDRERVPDGRGFMGKAWDSFVPPPAVWDECLRVLKPGGHLVAFAGSRTHDLMGLSIRMAGFEIRDGLAWLHAQGFPKGGSQLKPAFEPVTLARKPPEGTVAANVLKWGTGALNIEGFRIGMSDQDRAVVDNRSGVGPIAPEGAFLRGVGQRDGLFKSAPGGRWPANVVLDEHQAAALDEQSGASKSSRRVGRRAGKPDATALGKFAGQESVTMGHDDEGGASRFFYCAKASSKERPAYWTPACNCETVKPCQEQSPQRVTVASTTAGDTEWSTLSSGSSTTGPSHQDTTSIIETETSWTTESKTSSSSRSSNTSASIPGAIFEMGNGGSPAVSAGSSNQSPGNTGTSAPKDGHSTDAADPATSQRSWSPKNCVECGQPWVKFAHSTVKPLALMRWLVRLVTPPGGTVLDPFAGSGTTLEAAALEGFPCTGIELDPHYAELCRVRIRRADEAERDLFGETL